MPRIRTIKPDFFLDDELATLDIYARMVFIGLWTQADKEGKLEDKPKKLKVTILPYDNKDIDKLLWLLAESKFIQRYEANGKKYIKITNFNKHQRPHHTEQPSSIPEPNGATTVEQPFIHGNAPVGREGKGREGKGVIGFDDLWKRYPKKDGKKEAERHFDTTVKTEEDKVQINKALDNYIKSIANTERQYIKNGSTWFNNWRDWVDWEEQVKKTHPQQGVHTGELVL